MRILVAGIGSIGGWILARMTESGADVTGWARGETFDRLSGGEPLVLQSVEGDWSGTVKVTDAPDGPYDLTIVCGKVHQTSEMSENLHPGGVFVSAQNGLEGDAILRQRHDQVEAAVVYAGCNRVDPVTIVHTSNGFLSLANADIAAAISAAGVRTRVVDDIESDRWQKLSVNVASNGLCTILRANLGDAFNRPFMADLGKRIMRDVLAVATAEGVTTSAGWDDFIIDGIAASVGSPLGENRPSTLQDLEAGRRLEVDALTGEVLRRAARHGMGLSRIEMLDSLLRAVDPGRP